jgi:F420-dependent oxidoreductase-like protein
MIRLPDRCLVVLVGASGAGKSHWAAQQFDPDQIVSSDRLRAVVGRGEHDQRASKDAFEVLDTIVDKRLRRGLTTVVDSTALEADRRAAYRAVGAKHGVPVHAVLFPADERLSRERNKQRSVPVPSKVLTAQLATTAALAATLADEGFTEVHEPDDVAIVSPTFLTSPIAASRQQEDPMPLEFGLQISKWDWPREELGPRLAATARAAEAAGFTSISVMDHFVQIPGVGREWEDMPESYTTLGYLAAVTERARLGVLVTGVTYRNLAHLAKIVATLDVLSGGRAWCGLGAAWFAREHELYGWEFPPVGRRYELLEDALELLPLMWGPGSPRYEGRTITVAEATCYPRPLQDRVPIMVGGSGERRTLRLVAQHADACNLFGDADTVRRKVEVLRRHCDDVGRDPAEITVSQLSVAGLVDDGAARPTADHASVTEQIGRYRELAEAGVHQAIVGLHDAGDLRTIERFADVIAAFGPRGVATR